MFYLLKNALVQYKKICYYYFSECIEDMKYLFKEKRDKINFFIDTNYFIILVCR